MKLEGIIGLHGKCKRACQCIGFGEIDDDLGFDDDFFAQLKDSITHAPARQKQYSPSMMQTYMRSEPLRKMIALAFRRQFDHSQKFYMKNDIF